MDFMLTILDLPILESYFESRNHQNVCSKVLASKQEYLLLLVLVMGHDQNIRELNLNVISRCTIFGNCELCKWQFSLIFMILSKRFAKCCMISQEIANFTRIGGQLDFTIYKKSETWFREMPNIAFKCEFSVNVNSLTHHYRDLFIIAYCPNSYQRKLLRTTAIFYWEKSMDHHDAFRFSL